MEKTRFFFASYPDMLGAGLIIQNAAPYMIGRVYKFKDTDAMALHIANMGRASYARIGGYNILIKESGYLGEYPYLRADIKANILENMANFYYWHKVQEKPKYYRTWEAK